MYAQAVSSAVAKTNFAGFSLSNSQERHANSHLTAISSLQRKAPGETLFSEGDETNSVYEIVRGMLRLVKLLPDGRRQITGFLSSGNLVGLAPEGIHVYTAEAVTEVTLCRYGRVAFERLIDEAPGFAKRLLAVTSHELRAAQEQMLLLGRKTAMEKVASFLYGDRQAARRGRHAGSGCANDAERHCRLPGPHHRNRVSNIYEVETGWAHRSPHAKSHGDS